MRKKVRVTVFNEEQYDGDWPPVNAAGCLAWFSEKIDAIPSEYRASASIIISSRGGYDGDSYGHIEIYYERPETDEEMAEREAKEKYNRDLKTAYELRQLAALKAKYES